MKKKDLEIKLQNLIPFQNPKVELEQYPTHSSIATDILFEAYLNGDIEGKNVADFGCGTGIFSIGAFLLGAKKVNGYDIDEESISISKQNAEKCNCEIEFQLKNINEVNEKFDTVIMNPPFGSQNKHADRPFLEKAMETADAIYSIHMACTVDYLKKMVEKHERKIEGCITYKYEIPHTFSFHSKTKKTVEIVAVYIR